jgi:hypothetical protein
VNYHNTLTAEGAGGTQNLPRERLQGKEKKPQHGNPSKQAQRKATSEASQLVDYRTDPLNLRAAFKLKLPHLTGGGADQAAAAEG